MFDEQPRRPRQRREVARAEQQLPTGKR